MMKRRRRPALGPPPTVLGSYLGQDAAPGHAGGGPADERHDAVAIHGAVPLHVPAQVGEDARGAAALAVAAVAAVAAPPVAAADGDEE